MRGAVLTFGVPKGFWQPTAGCVFIEGPIAAKQGKLRDLSDTIRPGDDRYDELSAELAHTEEYATIITPLIWHKSRAPAQVSPPQRVAQERGNAQSKART